MNTEEGAVSDVDGSVLPSRPTFFSDRFPEDMELWLRSRLGLNIEAKIAYDDVNNYAFEELISPTYQYGKDNFTFFKIHNNEEYSDYHIQFAKMVADMQNYCESRGSRFYYVFNPEKEEIYRSKLPSGVNYDDSWVDSMLAFMDSLGVNYIDLREVLKTESEKELVFDQKNDAGHWNHDGAFYGMQEITKYIHQDFPAVKILEKDEYDVTSGTVEKLYASNLTINETVPEYSLKAGYKFVTGDFATEVERDTDYSFFQVIQNKSEEAREIRRMLLFEDDLYAPFAFSRSRETAVVSCLRNTINFDYYYNIFKPDVVIFENMEYVVNDKYFSQSAMKSANQNPAILANYPESDFRERKDQLLEQTTEENSDALAMLIPGKAVDKVLISKRYKKARYAYLITDDRVIDLKDDGAGALTASVRHGDLAAGSDVVLYVQRKNGTSWYAVVPVTSQKQNITYRQSTTENTVLVKDQNIYKMTNAEETDAFSYASLQLYNEDINKCLLSISSTSAAGTLEGGYGHKLQTGDYILLLRAGSNRASEWAAFSVHLEEGHSYWFTYTVDDFSDKTVTISGFSFSEPIMD